MDPLLHVIVEIIFRRGHVMEEQARQREFLDGPGPRCTAAASEVDLVLVPGEVGKPHVLASGRERDALPIPVAVGSLRIRLVPLLAHEARELHVRPRQRRR